MRRLTALLVLRSFALRDPSSFGSPGKRASLLLLLEYLRALGPSEVTSHEELLLLWPSAQGEGCDVAISVYEYQILGYAISHTSSSELFHFRIHPDFSPLRSKPQNLVRDVGMSWIEASMSNEDWVQALAEDRSLVSRVLVEADEIVGLVERDCPSATLLGETTPGLEMCSETVEVLYYGRKPAGSGSAWPLGRWGIPR